jgi:tetratricopeptide (TPR) repeat protein
MILPRRLVLLGSVLAVLPAAAQGPSTGPAAPDRAAAAPEISPAAAHNARLIERYQAMLAANPVEGLALDRLWKAAQDQGATAMLLDEYHRAADAQPPPVATILVYGHLLQRAGRLDEAKAAFQRAAAADPANVLPPLALGDLAGANAQPAAAAGFYEAAAAELRPDDRRRADILLKLGNAWMSAGEPLKAADAWEKIVADNPSDIALHRRLAENYEKNRLPERAIAHDEYIEQHADPEQRAGALRDLARLHEARGEIDAAGAALERGLALTAPDNWLHGELERSLIRLYQRAGRVPELAARWRADVARAPRDLGGYLRLERLAAAQGDADAQRAWLEQVVALAPRDRDDTLKLARLLADAGERERAAALYDTLLKDQPADLDLVLARAELDLQLGRPQAAVERIEACVARAPADESVTTPALQFFLSHHLEAAAEHRLQADAARQPQAEEPALALARFYFSIRREADGRSTLEALVRRPGDAAAKTSRLLRVADCYKDEHLLDDALRCWRQAADLNPAALAPWLAAADALATQAKTGEARDAFEHALKIAPPGPDRVEIEHKFYELLQTADAGSGATVSGELPAAPLRNAVPRPAGRQVEHHIKDLVETARAAPSAEAYLRLARWEAWNHAANDAAVAAEKVITLDPGNIPARELLVSIAGETHQRDVAEQRLREIMTLDPAQSAAARRQIAELKMEDGSFDEAIAIFTSLLEDAPGSVAALTDLALAQQRADRWYDALTTWERAYALPGATPAERTDVRRPLLLVLERLGQFPRGAEVLQSAIDEQTDVTARQDLFLELAAYCQRHDLTGWLEQQYDARRAAQPNDYFALTSLAALQKAAGHQQEAYQLLRRADFSAPDPVHSLQALVTAAEALGETAEAVSWQRRLLALPGQDTADNLERLANLQDGGLAIDEAARTWEQAVARFPRQSDVLDKAADFFEKSQRLGRARELLGQLMALDPSDLKRLFRLGQLDLATGDREGARVCFEQILARSEPEKPGLPLVPPPELKNNPEKPDAGFAAAVARFRTRFAVAAPEAEAAPEPPADDRQLRLAAIRQLSELLFPSGTAEPRKAAAAAPGADHDRQQWMQRWKTAAAAGARSEPLWAFYFSRDQAATMDALAGWMKAQPADEALRGAFTGAGLHLGAYRTLAHWAWDEANASQTASNGQLLVLALVDYLAAGGKPGPDMVAGLFPPRTNVRELLWKAAEEGFAAQSRYAEAAELGERVVALSSSSRANFALPVAQWELYLGRGESARAVLRTALAEGVGDSFEPGTNPVFVVLREYFLLLPENERSGFADEYLRKTALGKGPAHAVLAAVLLHGLLGDWKTADSDLDRLLALRMLASDAGGGSADARRWTYLLNNGLQLEEWGLEPLAVHLWQRALREASAFDRLDNETLTVRSEIRTRLLGLRVALAPDPSRARQDIEDYLREDPPPGNVALLAAQFRESAQWPAAVLLDEYLCRAEPADPEYWRNLFAAYQATGDHAACDQALTTLLDGAQPLPNSLSRIDLICREASAREEEGDGESARRLLERARQKSPHSVPLLAQLANSYVLAGQPAKAIALWREALPFDVEGHAALALATLEESGGDRPEAIKVLEAERQHLPGNFEATVQLGRLYAAAGRIDDLRALAAGRLQAGDLNAVIGMAAGIDGQAACLALRAILADAARRSHYDAQERFRAQAAVVDLYRTRAEDDAGFELEVHRLERFAGATPALRRQFMQERFDVARKRGADAWLEGELTREWHAGDGDVAAGALLVRLYLQNDRADALRKVTGEIDRRPDLPDLTLFAIGQELGSSKYAALALPVAQRLTRRFPEKEAYALARARACWMAGRPDEARALLDTLDVTSVFVDNLADRIGDLYAALGDRAGMREFYGRAVARDPWALRALPAYLRLAQADIEEKQFEPARRLLLTAYRNPACADLSPLLAYLAATGRSTPDAASRLPGAEFPLGSAGRARLLTALCESLDKTQPAEARRLAMAHPELWSEAPAVVDSLCAGAGPGDWPALAAALEDALLQASPPSRQLARALGLLDASWAAAELKDGAHGAEALAHLTRAHELQPDDFAIAGQLAGLYVEKKQMARATEVLRDFLTPNAFPAERRQAQQILARK